MPNYAWDDKARVWTCRDGSRRRGRRAVVSADLAALRDPAPLDSHPIVSDAVRTQALRRGVEEALLEGGTALHVSEFSAVISHQKIVHHGLHIVLSVLTLGLWLVVYAVALLSRGDLRYRLDVDAWGHVWPTMR